VTPERVPTCLIAHLEKRSKGKSESQTKKDCWLAKYIIAEGSALFATES
jgi:hypothetical protein